MNLYSYAHSITKIQNITSLFTTWVNGFRKNLFDTKLSDDEMLSYSVNLKVRLQIISSELNQTY